MARLVSEFCNTIKDASAMKFKRFIAQSISRAFQAPSRGFRLWKGFRILLYHAVGSNLPHDSYGISIDPVLFEQHMKLLAGMSNASLVPFADQIDSSSLLRIAVTFDDGYKDNLTAAAPVLVRYGIPFTVFTTISHVRGSSPLYIHQNELKELAALPCVSIGSHGVTHRPLTSCDDATLWEELYGSKCYLEDLIGKPISAISYPHGQADRRVRDAAVRAGYIIGGCSLFGVNTPKRDAMFLRRTEVVASDSAGDLFRKVFGAWDWYRLFQNDPALV